MAVGLFQRRLLCFNYILKTGICIHLE